MPRHVYAAVTIVIIWSGIGCDSQTKTNRVPAKKVSPESKFASRLEAALAISFQDQRDQTLATLAKDAAEAGDEEVVKEAVKNIRFVDLRDRTAADCAMALQKAGKQAASVTLAKTISFIDLRDRVLSDLAKRNK
jgi:hypothetical protein